MRLTNSFCHAVVVLALSVFAVASLACSENEGLRTEFAKQPDLQSQSAVARPADQASAPPASSDPQQSAVEAAGQLSPDAQPEIATDRSESKESGRKQPPTKASPQVSQSDSHPATQQEARPEALLEFDINPDDFVYLPDRFVEFKACPGTDLKFDPATSMRDSSSLRRPGFRAMDLERFPHDPTKSGTVAVDLSVSRWHVCALMEDGTVRCWGRTAYEPMPVAGSFTQIDGACGLRPDGSFDCWGGALSAVPFVAPPDYFTRVASHGDRLCGLKPDGTVECCGYGDRYQLAAPTGSFFDIGVYEFHNCAIRDDMTIACWGGYTLNTDKSEGSFVDHAYLQYTACGLSPAGEISCWDFTESEVVEPPANVSARLTSGFDQYCALGADNFVRCWDTYPIRQYGYEAKYTPTEQIVDIGSGFDFACGLSTSGTVQCWGGPVDVWQWPQPPGGKFAQVVIGLDDYSVCGLRENGVAVCWGYTLAGDWVPPGPYTQISVGSYYACGVRLDGTISCWGEGYPDDVIDESAEEPEIVTELFDGPYVQVDVHWRDVCAVRADGSTVCWNTPVTRPSERTVGNNPGNARQLSLTEYLVCRVTSSGAVDCGSTRAEDIPDFDAPVSEVHVQDSYACALLVDGAIQCWHWPEYDFGSRWGQDLSPNGRFVQLSTGSDHACAVGLEGIVQCWGLDQLGQASPPPRTFTQVSVGSEFSCGVRPTGEIECWGYDFNHNSPFRDSE